MNKQTILKRAWMSVGAAVCAGLLRVQMKKGALFGDDDGSKIEDTERKIAPDERLFGPGLFIEMSSAGIEYVRPDGPGGRAVALIPFQVVYEELSDDDEVVLTENGIRILDRKTDPFPADAPFQMVWKDPRTQEWRTLDALPAGSRVRSYDVVFIEDGMRCTSVLKKRDRDGNVTDL